MDLKPEPLSSWTNTQTFGQTGQMIDLCSEYLSVRCIWLYVLFMSRMRFRGNPYSIVSWMSKKLLARSRREIWSLSDCNRARTQNHLLRKWTLNHLASLAKWLSVHLRTKRFSVRVQLQSPKLQISRLLRGRSSLTFRQLWSVDSIWNAYVTWQEHIAK